MGLLSHLFPPPTPERFARLVTRELRRQGVEGPINYDRQAFQLTFGEWVFNLRNVYTEFRNLPRGQRSDTVRHFVGSFSSRPKTPATWEDAKALVLPKVRERMFFEIMELGLRLEGKGKPDTAVTPDSGRRLLWEYRPKLVKDDERMIFEHCLVNDCDLTPQQVDQALRRWADHRAVRLEGCIIALETLAGLLPEVLTCIDGGKGLPFVQIPLSEVDEMIEAERREMYGDSRLKPLGVKGPVQCLHSPSPGI